MSDPTLAEWQEANQRYVIAMVARLQQRIERRRAGDAAPEPTAPPPWTLPRPPAIVALAQAFGLSEFERDVLMLSAAVELDAGFESLCASTRGANARAVITFGFALAVLDGGHWSAIAPAGPLRYWQLLQLVGNDGPTQSALRIDERILNCIAGIDHLDAHLATVARFLEPEGLLMPSQLPALDRITDAWTADRDSSPTAIQVCASDSVVALQLCASACLALDLRAMHVRAQDIPHHAQDRAALARLCEREAVLSRCVVVLDGAWAVAGSAEERAMLAFIDELQVRLLLTGVAGVNQLRRRVLRIEVPASRLAERKDAWLEALGPVAATLNGTVERLATHFDLSGSEIRAIGGEVAQSGAEAAIVEDRLWETCRVQTRARLDDLADRIELVASWDDLILPGSQIELLREIAAHVRLRGRVFESWGFSARSSRATGTCAVFAGPSGTGKTLAAEVLAKELHLDLYRVDLSRTVSKYIGETEKNLARIFDAGERAGAVLLFDEADALFGKRSDVRDSHDRYANIEVSYLLQRMEAFRGGLAILTTNMKGSIDAAFMRRLRFVVQFPFPDLDQRVALWHRVFPRDMPRSGLDHGKLARLSITGANIRNIAVNAAFRAADADAPVGMDHVLWAARQEYAKLDRSLSDAEIRGWL
ncbi:MAG TPA: AAA family ATPase [Steroidobacteraceae bacterium]|jgi:hypothetical protein|nr:AAA family ATPase [Steroidobacteraceae bacterium]